MMTTGVIGLGDMGSGLAKNLIANGFEVTGRDLKHDRMAAFVLSPWGAATLLVTAALALAGLYLELAGIS